MKIGILLSPVNLPQEIPFYCMRCRSMLMKQNRDILLVGFNLEYPAMEIPLGMGWTNYQCHSCKVQYNFYYQ
jgi:hypothetical protein